MLSSTSFKIKATISGLILCVCPPFVISRVQSTPKLCNPLLPFFIIFSSADTPLPLVKPQILIVALCAVVQEEDENFPLCLQFAQSNFRYHRFLDVDSHRVTRQLEG